MLLLCFSIQSGAICGLSVGLLCFLFMHLLVFFFNVCTPTLYTAAVVHYVQALGRQNSGEFTLKQGWGYLSDTTSLKRC